VLCLLVLGLAGCGGGAPGSGSEFGVGRPAPGFSLESLAGGKVSLRDYRGHVVLINLWATWCPPCKSEIPVLQSAYQEHKEEGLVILGINIGESSGVVRAFVAQTGVTYPVLLDSESVMLGKLRVLGLPVSVLVDGDGIVRARVSGELSKSRLEGLLESLLPVP
jgi:thiol-disulfide isomerase/thioredoxin